MQQEIKMNSGLLSSNIPRSRAKGIGNNSTEEPDFIINHVLPLVQTCITPITDLTVDDSYTLNPSLTLIANELYQQITTTCSIPFYQVDILADTQFSNVCSLPMTNLIKINYV